MDHPLVNDDDAHGVGFEDLGLDHDEPAPRIHTPYEQVMGFTAEHVPHEALAQRLGEFREWLKDDAKCIINPYLSIVNGEAHDGTKNAPTWTVEKGSWETDGHAAPSAVADSSDRCGMIDLESDRDLYDRGMGCCVMATKEIKKEEVLMQIPQTAMITPDVIAASDAGRVALACCERDEKDGSSSTSSSSSFWDTFAQAGEKLEINKDKFKTNRGEHLLIRILQERKKAETATKKYEAESQQQQGEQQQPSGEKSSSDAIPCKLAAKGSLSRKVPFQLFLIQQRFTNDSAPAIVSKLMQNGDELKGVDSNIRLPEDTPSSFGPYARTLPSVIPLPVCWRRQELALLSGCISGSDALQEVVARTVQLVSEYKTLLEAGILYRFPNIFPPGMITWERWVWADAVLTSRLLPTECYLNDGDKRADSMSAPLGEDLMQSPTEVWDDMGVLIPLLDMLNHECDDAPITWEQNLTESKTITNNGKEVTVDPHLPRARAHKRIRKHMQIYVSYGSECNNYDLMNRYGFAVTRNPNDEVKIGWSVAGAVGGVSAPKDYISPFQNDEDEDDGEGKAMEEETKKEDDNSSSNNKEPKQRALSKDLVFEADDKSAPAKSWWTSERFALLEREMKGLENDAFHASLRSNKPLVIMANNSGSYHPHLLVAAAIATMPAERVEHYSLADEKEASEGSIGLTKHHCKILQRYLHFFFTSKIEKLLTSLSSLVSNHFDKIKLWTKMAHGGLNFVAPKDETKSPVVDATGGMPVGWMEFVNTYGIPYSIATEKSKKYCALTPEACALFFYDGHLNALQTSIDGIIKDEKFESGVLRQLEDLGFTLMSEEDEAKEVLRVKPKPPPVHTEEKRKVDAISKTNGVSDTKSHEGHKKKKKKKSKRGHGGNNGNDRPPTIKLHIGNLSYQTQTSDLYEYFGTLYGRDHVLECHIPVERETGRSRGFGFVTLPEAVALSILQSERKHEIKGRLLKVAESNSAGSTNRGRVSAGQQMANDRCARCGYRPKYCICATPDIPAAPPPVNGRGAFHEEPPPPPPRYDMHHSDPYGRAAEHDYYSGGHRRDRDRESYHSHSPSRRRRDRDYDRDYRYDRSRSRSYSRGRDRDHHRERRRDRDRRGRSRSRDRHRRRSYEHRSRSSRYASHSEESDQSYPDSSSRRRGGGAVDVATERGKPTSPSRSVSPPRRRRRSRSRSRDRDRRRRSSKKSRKRRSRSRSPAASQSRTDK